MKIFLKYLKIFALLNVSFFIFSVLSCMMPTEWYKKNIKESLPELLEEGNYPKTILKGKQYQQDNFTDVLVLNISISSDSKKPVWSALMNPYSFDTHDKGSWNSVKSLEHKSKNWDISPNVLYGRYWHGNASFCRFLLPLMNYQDIKLFLYMISTILLLIFLIKIINRAGWIKSFPLFLALLFANLFVTQFSIQFFPVMAISLICGILICNKRFFSQKKASLLMFVTGCFTAFFDLLTTPLLTLGIPLIVYMVLFGETKKTLLELFKFIFILSLLWFMGYACTWATKWALVCIFANSESLDVINTIIWRTGTKDYTRWEVIVANFLLLPYILMGIILAFLLLLSVLCFNKKRIIQAISFLIIGLLPYIWYFVLSNHSYQHWWFTYRAQVISMASAMLFFVSLIDWERLMSIFKIKNSKSSHLGVNKL